MATQLKLQQGGNSIEVSEKAFGREFNEALVHQVVTAYMAGGRAGTKRSPIWVGGGRAFAARPRDFSQKVNRKMYRGAIATLLSELARLERLTVVETFALEAPKTKMLADKLKELGLCDVLIIVEAYDEKLELASRNLMGVTVLPVTAVDPVSLVRHERVLATVGAIRMLEEQLA